MKSRTAYHIFFSLVILFGVLSEIDAQTPIYSFQNISPNFHNHQRYRSLTKTLDSLDNHSCPPVYGLDSTIIEYLKKYSLPGASLAIMRDDALIYVKGYGYADKENRIPVQPYNRFRIASTSKLLTATAIMVLMEEGKLSLSDHPFAPDGILGDEPYISAITDSLIYAITVNQLLRHESGFNCPNGKDPMFSGNKIDATIIPLVLKRPLGFIPGTSQEYSNFGYYMLGRIIEKVTGEDYAEWVQKRVLKPSRCFNFSLGYNYETQLQNKEVHYYMHKEAKLHPDISGSHLMVETCYGGNDVRGVEAAGGWIASSPELCRFVASIDAYEGIEDILSEQSIREMTRQTTEKTFGIGWSDSNADGVWTRTGSFGGTTAIIKYFSKDRECWVLLTNGSTWMGASIAKKSGRMITQLKDKYQNVLPANDLFFK